MSEVLEFTQEVSTKELDAHVEQLRKIQEEYERHSAMAKELHFALENQKKKLMELLMKAGKTKYDAEGIGKVQLVDRMSVSYPKDLEARKQFVTWITDRLGEEGLLTYLTVNSQTLNSMYKQEFENADDPAMFSIPGLSEPTANTSVRFNRTK